MLWWAVPPSSCFPPPCGCILGALVQVSSGLHCHSGTSFLKPCFLIRTTVFFKCILLPSLHTLMPSTKNERRGVFSCGWFRRCEKPDVLVNFSTFCLHALHLLEQLGVWSSFPLPDGWIHGMGALGAGLGDCIWAAWLSPGEPGWALAVFLATG